MSGTFLSAEWRDLVMVNYEADPAILIPLVPRGTELDFWEGRALISMVGFLFLNTKVMGIPVPFHRNFEAVNLRFYVRRKSADGWRRGVVFIREIVPRFAIAAIARMVYNEKYISLPMRHEIQKGEEQEIRYEWECHGSWNSIFVKTMPGGSKPIPGSQEEFITEHFWGYSVQKDGGTIEYQVEHPQWSVSSTSNAILKCDIAGLYGMEYESALSSQPVSAFVADGSEVRVLQGHRIRHGI